MADTYKSDDFSLFLHQILLHSSSSPSITGPISAQLGSGSGHRNLDPIIADGYFPANLPSSSMGHVDNDVDDQECESEDGGFEVLAEEAPAKTALSRNSSKRCRAAEVHNLSEKRRRRRINEKMKALQYLIPNSNKTDKASMLDEAIEYLKQLQLQVQMLTMRNGLSLYPMCLPGVSDPSQLTPINLGHLEGNGPLNMGLMGLPNVAQETSNSARLPGPEISTEIHSGTSLGFPSMVADIFRGDVLPHQGQDADHCQTNLLGLEMVEKALSTQISCDARSSRIEENAFEARVLRRPDNELLTSLQSDKEIAPHFHK